MNESEHNATSQLIPRQRRAIAALVTCPTVCSQERVAQPITFGQFAAEARRRNFTQEDLVGFCREWWGYARGSSLAGAYDTPGKFAERVFQARYANVEIPYRPLIQLYLSWQDPQKDLGKRLCNCGCGKVVLGRRRYACGACRQRAYRHAQNGEKSHEQSIT